MNTGQHMLADLDDTDLDLARMVDDVRGRTVIDRDGEELGEVDGLLVDEDLKAVRFLAVGSGGFLGLGRKTRLIPAGSVTEVEVDKVHVGTTRQSVAESPAYDPDLVEAPRYEDYYAYYGQTPHWDPAYQRGPWPPVH